MSTDPRFLILAARDGERPAPYAYDEFERRAQRAREAARRREHRAGGAAVAAVLLALLGGLLYVGSRAPAPQLHAAATPPPVVREVSAAHWLAAASEPVIVRVGSYAAVTALEDRIAYLDACLNDSRVSGEAVPVDAATLGRERARLLNTLASVRYAQTLADNLQ